MNITELTAKLKAAAQEEIMFREACDTSDLWQDEASPENVLALLEALESAQSRIAELESRERHTERQSVIDGLAASGETWEEIQEYMKSWDAARAAGIKLQIEGE